jgi:hypothetical protein
MSTSSSSHNWIWIWSFRAVDVTQSARYQCIAQRKHREDTSLDSTGVTKTSQKQAFLGNADHVDDSLATLRIAPFVSSDDFSPGFQDATSTTSSAQGHRRRSTLHQKVHASPFKMVYDWENKEEICYRMYIEEKKSLEEIMEYMKEEFKFTPS